MQKSRYGITAPLLVTAGQIISEPLVVVEDGRIVAVESRQHAQTPANLAIQDFPGCTLAPGFIDIHIHGGAGHDVMEGEDSALACIERHLVRTGVTSYF